MRHHRLGVVAAIAASAALLLAAGQATSAPPAHAPVVPPGIADPSGNHSAGERPDDESLRFGDGTYLNGYDYLRGVNVYSLIFPGKSGDLALIGESQASYEFLASRGVTIVRLPVPWQRLQEIPDGGTPADGLASPFSEPYLDVVEEQVRRAAAAGIRTVIDLHNGCTYPWGAGVFIEGSLRCGAGITEEHVTRLWTTLADRFRGDERVAAYDIFNEPRWSVGADVYKRYAQVAVDAIRSTGDEHTLWVEGILSDVRGRLAAIAPEGPWIEDPLGKVMYSEHFYDNEAGDEFDPSADHTIVLERLRTFGDWCKEWAVRCAVGEVGWPSGGETGVQSKASGEAWNALFEQFYTIADEYELDVTHFAASSAAKVGTLLTYVATSPGIPSASGIDQALSQAEVVERHLSRPATAGERHPSAPAE